MRKYVILASFVLPLIVGPGAWTANASEQKRFEKLLQKYAVRNSVLQAGELKPKGACVCLGGATVNRPGFVLWIDEPSGSVFCMVPNPFGPNGVYAGASSCAGTWTMLAK